MIKKNSFKIPQIRGNHWQWKRKPDQDDLTEPYCTKQGIRIESFL